MLRVLIASILVAYILPALARDDGRYAQSPLKQWFDQLKSAKGACCSDADGEATDYEIRNGSYWAPIDGVMTEVPPGALLTVPKRAGHAIKWLYNEGGRKAFRCFIPASGA